MLLRIVKRPVILIIVTKTTSGFVPAESVF